jgi:hypothetical protein
MRGGIYRGWPVVTDSEGRGRSDAETASSETDCTRDSALSVRKSESRVAA